MRFDVRIDEIQIDLVVLYLYVMWTPYDRAFVATALHWYTPQTGHTSLLEVSWLDDDGWEFDVLWLRGIVLYVRQLLAPKRKEGDHDRD